MSMIIKSRGKLPAFIEFFTRKGRWVQDSNPQAPCGALVFKTSSLPIRSNPPLKGAEEVGLEPTGRCLDGYSLANWWNDRYPTPPFTILYYLNFCIFSNVLDCENQKVENMYSYPLYYQYVRLSCQPI